MKRKYCNKHFAQAIIEVKVAGKPYRPKTGLITRVGCIGCLASRQRKVVSDLCLYRLARELERKAS